MLWNHRQFYPFEWHLASAEHGVSTTTVWNSLKELPSFRMLLRYLPRFAFGVLLLVGCSRSRASLPGLDKARWTQDTYGCQNQRAAQAKVFLKDKEQLYGSTTATIESLLGRPDEEELAEQTEKTYYYYLEAGPQCEPGHTRSNANKLSIHFGAIGTVTEVLTERPLVE